MRSVTFMSFHYSMSHSELTGLTGLVARTVQGRPVLPSSHLNQLQERIHLTNWAFVEVRSTHTFKSYCGIIYFVRRGQWKVNNKWMAKIQKLIPWQQRFEALKVQILISGFKAQVSETNLKHVIIFNLPSRQLQNCSQSLTNSFNKSLFVTMDQTKGYIFGNWDVYITRKLNKLSINVWLMMDMTIKKTMS